MKTIGAYIEHHYAPQYSKENRRAQKIKISMEAGVDPTNEPYRRVPLERRYDKDRIDEFHYE